MKDNIQIQVKGKLEITLIDKYGQILESYYKENQVQPGALKILTRCLSQIGITRSLDFMAAEGPGVNGTTEAAIVETNFPGDNKIELIAIFDEYSFNGEINTLILRSSAVGEDFSIKTGLSIVKTEQLRLKVKWIITINN